MQSTQGFNTVKLVFISMYVYYDYYVNFDWCRKVPYSRNQLHAVSRGAASGRCDSGRFLLGVRPDRTPSKNGPESQGPREGQMRTACSTSTVPGVASIAVRSARDRSSDYMHAFSISDDLIP